MHKRIITVSRQFGSGGRTIAKTLSEKLGIAYYDKELVKKVALETGFAPEFVEEHGEYAQSKSKFAFSLGLQRTPGVMNGLSMAEFLWAMQREVIVSLAEKEPCIIVGRCADYILKDRDDCIHTYIHADIDYRADRVVRLYGESEKDPITRVNDKDAKRKVNYEYFTQREWGNSENYDIALNSSKLGEDLCVDLIIQAYLKEY